MNGATGTLNTGRKNKGKILWRLKRDFKSNYALYFMLLLPLVILIIYNYIPLYGLKIAFQRFKPAAGMFGEQEFVGLKWFKYLFAMEDFKYAIRNTLVLAISKMFITMLVAIIFALLLNEMKHMRLKRIIQTSLYLPHFISWIILAGIFVDLLSINGPLNRLIMFLGGSAIPFLSSNDYFQQTIVATDVWKEFGFGTIIYLAAVTGIDQELYEAAEIDGANRWKKALNITLPGMIPIISLMALLNIGGVLSGNFDQVFNMYSPIVYRTGDILDTLVYRIGLVNFNFSLSTAVGLFRALVGLVLIGISYGSSYKFAGYRIF